MLRNRPPSAILFGRESCVPFPKPGASLIFPRENQPRSQGVLRFQDGHLESGDGHLESGVDLGNEVAGE